MRRIVFKAAVIAAFLSVSPALSETQAQTNDKPIVLSVADIQDITGGAVNVDANVLSKKGVRNQVVSELVQNYDVVVLSRSQSYCFVVEGKVKSFSSIDSPTNNSISLPASDMAVCATLIDRTTSGKLEGDISYIDLASKPYKVVTNVVFAVDSAKEIAPQIVRQIVDTLHLQPRKEAVTKNNPMIWTVLPFSGADTKNRARIQENIELALQKSGKVKNLVDRTALDKVLQELKISAMEGINQNIGGKIGKMVGADMILMGWVDGSRIDIQLVDAKTAAIIDARYMTCPKDRNVDEVAGEIVSDIVASGRSSISVGISLPEQRQAEEDYYFKLALNIYDMNGVFTLSRLTFIMNNMETAFLLGYPNPQNAETMAEELIEIIEHSTPNYGENSVSPEIGDKAVRILESLLDISAGSEWLTDPLMWRINAYMAKNDFKTALSLIDEYQKKSPDSLVSEKTKCLIKLGRNSEAQTLISKSGHQPNSKDTYKIDIATKKGKELYQVFKKQFEIGSPYRREWEPMNEKRDFDSFCRLQLQYESPEDALTTLNGWETNVNHWIRNNITLSYGLLLQQARCLKLLGRKEEAVRKCKDVIAFRPKTAIPFGDYFNEASKTINEIESEIGLVKELWLTAAEIKQLPPSRYIYIIPTENVNMTLLNDSAKTISRFFGAKLRILDSVSVPKDSQKRPESDQSFLSAPFLTNILRNAKVPDDALFLALITKEDIYFYNHNKSDKKDDAFIHDHYTYSPCRGNPILYSYAYDWYGNQEINSTKFSLIRKTMLGFLDECMPDSNDDYYFPFCRKRCAAMPCINAAVLNYYTRIGLCQYCQEQYKRVDFEKVHADLMDYLKKAGAKIVKPEEVKFTEPIMQSSSIPCWYVIGPFDNPGGAPADVEQAPEKEPFELSKTYPGVTNTTVRWQKCVGDTNKIFLSDFIVDLNDLYGKPTNVAAVAVTWVDSPKDMDAVLGIGSEDGFVAWVNGKRVGQLLKAERTYASCGDKFPIHLKKGENEIRLKITLTQFGWKFGANILDSKELPADVRYRLKDN